MARIAGVDLPRGKRIEVALTYIYGIGPTRASQIIQSCGVDPDRRTQDLDDDDVNRSLVLREPHLERAEAALTKAKNEISKAELDLTRTSVVAPFDAVVIDESVEIGQLVEPGNTICTLAGTDAFWVRVSLLFEELQWIRLPAKGRDGARVTISLDTGTGAPVTWTGEVERFLGDLETSTRMARVVVRVDDPLGLDSTSGKTQRSPLLIGTFVSVEIDAGILEDVISIPSSALRDGNKIWVVDSAELLQIREVEVLWKNGDALLISNTVNQGEKLIVSDLRAALPGMKVKPQQGSAPTSDVESEIGTPDGIPNGHGAR